MNDWKEYAIGQLFCSHVPGEWGSPPTGHAGDMLILRSTNFTNSGKLDFSNVVVRHIPLSKRKKCRLEIGDLLLEKSGGGPEQPVGRVVLFDDKSGANYGFANFLERLIVSPGFDPKFITYLLLNGYVNGLTLRYEQQTTGIRNFKLGDYFKEKIKVAPPPEQRKIVAIMTTADNLIDRTEAVIAKYQAYKQGLMHDLFTRGIDARGQLRPSQIDSPNLYEQSALGWIPKGWHVQSVNQLFINRREHGRPGLPVMAVTGVDGLVERSSVDRRVESNLTPYGHALVERGDIVYNMMRMWQGVLGYAKYDCLVSPAYIILKPTDKIRTVFAAFLFKFKSTIAKFRQYSQGVVDDRLRLYFRDLVRIQLAVPKSVDEQEQIEIRIAQLNASIESEQRLLKKYVDAKAGLMQDLLTEKVRVKVGEGGEVGV
ncbi:MAG: restriction endonuclease subunit S [Planctomycetota bacterium]